MELTYWHRHVCVSVRPFVRSSDHLSAWSNSVPTEQSFVKFYIYFFENLSRKFPFHYDLTRMTGTLHEYQYTLLVISLSVLSRIRNVSDKTVEKIKTRNLCSVVFFPRKSENWKNRVDAETPHLEKMCFASQNICDKDRQTLMVKEGRNKRTLLRFRAALVCTRVQVSWNVLSFKNWYSTYSLRNSVAC